MEAMWFNNPYKLEQVGETVRQLLNDRGFVTAVSPTDCSRAVQQGTTGIWMLHSNADGELCAAGRGGTLERCEGRRGGRPCVHCHSQEKPQPAMRPPT